MAEQYDGKVEIVKTGTLPPNTPNSRITLDGDTAIITVGSNEQRGLVILMDHEGNEFVRLGSTWSPGDPIQLGVGEPRGIMLKDSGGKVRIRLSASSGDIEVGGNGVDGDVILNDKDGKKSIILDAKSSRIALKDNGQERLRLDAHWGDILVGGNGEGGAIFVYPKSATNINELSQATITLDGGTADLFLGGGGKDGAVVVRNGAGQERLRLYGKTPGGGFSGAAVGVCNVIGKETIYLQGNGGNLTLRDISGKNTIHLDGDAADLFLGGGGKDGAVVVRNGAGDDSILLDGKAGDIILKNADCAEDFDIAELEEVVPGTVMVLDQDGRLRQSREAYDTKVAGVISGAGDYRPGLVLDRNASQKNRTPIALMGKVYCKVDAESSPIEVGDLLTTSSTPGHAMKADNPLKAFGAVIGKALHPLKAGQGLIPILIALQ